MALAFVAARASAAKKGNTGGDQVSAPYNAAVAAGRIILVPALIDSGTANPPDDAGTQHAFATCYDLKGPGTPPLPWAVTDQKANPFAPFLDTMGGGVTGPGATSNMAFGLFKAKLATAVTTSDFIIVNGQFVPDVKLFGAAEFSVAAGKDCSVALADLQANESATALPLSTPATPSGAKIALVCYAVNGPSTDTFTPPAGYTAISAPSYSGGPAAANKTIRWARKAIASGTAGESPAASFGTARGIIGALFILREV